MQITIQNPEQFATWHNVIGVVLFSRPQDSIVNFFTEDLVHQKVKRDELGSPSMVDLMKELEENAQLRYIAEQNNLLTIDNQQTLDFLKYASSYN